MGQYKKGWNVLYEGEPDECHVYLGRAQEEWAGDIYLQHGDMTLRNHGERVRIPAGLTIEQQREWAYAIWRLS